MASDEEIGKEKEIHNEEEISIKIPPQKGILHSALDPGVWSYIVSF